MKFFDFGEIQKSEETIYRTWTELRYSLKNKDFGYKDIDEAKVFDDGAEKVNE